MDHKTVDLTGQPFKPKKSNAAIKVYCAIRIKAGATGTAKQPPGGWPAYCGVDWRGFRDAVKNGLPGITRLSTCPKTHFQIDGRPTRDFVAVAPDWLTLRPAEFAVMVVLSNFAAGKNKGTGWAGVETIAKRAGITRRTAQSRLKAIKAAGFFRRESGKWKITTRSENLTLVFMDDLERLGLDFQRPVQRELIEAKQVVAGTEYGLTDFDTYAAKVLPHIFIGKSTDEATKRLRKEWNALTFRDMANPDQFTHRHGKAVATGGG